MEERFKPGLQEFYILLHPSQKADCSGDNDAIMNE